MLFVVCPQKDDYATLFALASEGKEAYIRDARLVSGGLVFLLGPDEMLYFACREMVFAGDATYKTVQEVSSTYATPSWYLYNIVVAVDATRTSHESIVVARALMTTVTSEAHECVWFMFLTSMRKRKAKSQGLSERDVSIDVPYMNLVPERKKNAIPIREITTDFEVGEVEGIAEAVTSIPGGSVSINITHLMIGCHVYYERLVLRKAGSSPIHDRERFKTTARTLHALRDENEATSTLAVIYGTDNGWGSWCSRDHVRPLISPAFSGMSDFTRMIGFKDRNIVESQNRRANIFCRTKQDPVTCVLKQRDLDRITTTKLLCDNPGCSVAARAVHIRQQKGHNLSPSHSTSQPKSRKHRAPHSSTKFKRRAKIYLEPK